MSPNQRPQPRALTWVCPASVRWDLRSTTARLFSVVPTFLLQWSVRRQTTLTAEDTLSWHRKREGWSRACKHIQAAVVSWSLTFHGNASPGVFLRALKVWSWRARAKQGDASNGERLNQSLKLRYGTSGTSFLSVELKRQINGYLIVLALFLFIYFFVGIPAGKVPRNCAVAWILGERV